MDRDAGEFEAVAKFYIGPNAPCYDGDEPYHARRSGLDATYV